MNVFVPYFMAPVKSAFVFRLLPRLGPPNTVVLPLPFTKGVKKKGAPWRVSYTSVYSSCRSSDHGYPRNGLYTKERFALWSPRSHTFRTLYCCPGKHER